ncbi:hypothetical protein SALBM217S_04936 [Streptomyces griseoloalbus]
MPAADVVTASLAALETGEVVCVPGLTDAGAVTRLRGGGAGTGARGSGRRMATAQKRSRRATGRAATAGRARTTRCPPARRARRRAGVSGRSRRTGRRPDARGRSTLRPQLSQTGAVLRAGTLDAVERCGRNRRPCAPRRRGRSRSRALHGIAMSRSLRSAGRVPLVAATVTRGAHALLEAVTPARTQRAPAQEAAAVPPPISRSGQRGSAGRRAPPATASTTTVAPRVLRAVRPCSKSGPQLRIDVSPAGHAHGRRGRARCPPDRASACSAPRAPPSSNRTQQMLRTLLLQAAAKPAVAHPGGSGLGFSSPVSAAPPGRRCRT